jgi:DNA-binding NtrC family response regulator
MTPNNRNDKACVEDTVEYVLKRHVVSILDRCNWNKTRAAEVLGISVKTVYNYYRRWELWRDEIERDLH